MSDAKKETLVMNHHVSLTYEEELTPILDRYVDALMDGHIVGHKCPQCGRVYVPGKGYCPLCVVPTTERNEVEVADTGTVTGFTIITPVAYYGQTETEPFVYASVLLDGADATLGGQDIVGIPHDEVRAGLRVRAIWKPPEKRNAEGISNRGWGSVSSVIDAFEATGEPDMDRAKFEEHIF
jgi:uncharacterized protein